jgi:charged multivesicular body protein 3
MAKVTGSLQRSTEIMKLSNSLVKLPQISQAMREMSMEMTKVWNCCICMQNFSSTCSHVHEQAGILEEMADDMWEQEEDEEIEVEADAEVDKVLYELTDGKLGLAGSVGADLPVMFSLRLFQTCFLIGNYFSHYMTELRKRKQRGRWRNTDGS